MKKKLIITAALTAAIMAAGAVGGTIAYFSTSNETDIDVTSGKINVSSVVSELKTFSLDVEQEEGKFENGGTAALSGNVITLDRMSPGDKVTFKIAVTCDNNIKIKYRVAFNKIGDLAPALEANVTGGASDWVMVNPSDTPTVVNLEGSVAMPISTGLEYSDKTGSVRILVEAVQGNMPQAVSTLAEFEEAIADAANGEASLYLEDDIQVTHTIEIPNNAEINIYGDGETAITTPSNVKRPFILDTISNSTLTLSGVNIEGNGAINQSNGIGLWDTENCTVNLYDVNLDQPDYYALNVGTGNEGLEINVEDSVIEGWCALNVWSAGVTVNVKNSTLRGINDHSGVSNAFAVAVFNGGSQNSVINFNNSVVEAIQNGDQAEAFISIREDNITINSVNTVFKQKRQGETQFDVYNSIEEVFDYNSWLWAFTISGESASLDDYDYFAGAYPQGVAARKYELVDTYSINEIFTEEELTDTSAYIFGEVAALRQAALGANGYATPVGSVNGKQYLMPCKLTIA